jgi:nicotinate-nucleotide pyrophosphorylase (carboxylating)
MKMPSGYCELDTPVVRKIVRLALEEDIGSGDITTFAVVDPSRMAMGSVIAKEDGVLAGIPLAMMVLKEVDEQIEVSDYIDDGTTIKTGTEVLKVKGKAISLLQAERQLLNFVMRLSGIATIARRFMEALGSSPVSLLDTRKTTPGLRALEKYAVRVGGGKNHRMGLYDGCLIKNNHLALCKDIKQTVRKARAHAPMPFKVEVEVRTIEEAKRAIEAGADILLLDHMSPDEVVKVVDLAAWKVQLEVSGNITLDNIGQYAHTGVDFISVGALTKSANWLDFSMSIVPMEE